MRISDEPIYLSCQILIYTKSQRAQFVNRQTMPGSQGHRHARTSSPHQEERETPCAELPELCTQRRLRKTNPKLPDKCSLGCIRAHRCDILWQVQLGSSACSYLCFPHAAPQLLSFSPSPSPGRTVDAGGCFITACHARGQNEQKGFVVISSWVN